ncbi:MAG: hypothetical protein KC425_22860 [Anaerolineales bacterium]|nr:hypothetical protein [Anaerolineales bacterium]
MNGLKWDGIVDEAAVRLALAGLPAGRRVVVQLRAAGGVRLVARGQADRGFELLWQNGAGTRFSEGHRLGMDAVAGVLAAFAREDGRWQTQVAWRALNAGPGRWRVPVGLAALLIFGVPYGAVLLWRLAQGAPGGPTVGEGLLGFAAVAAIAGYMQYVELFLGRIRPWLAAVLGRRLGLQIRADETDARWYGGAGAGTWEADGGWGKRLLLYALDLSILLLGLIGPAAVVTIGAFVILGATD